MITEGECWGGLLGERGVRLHAGDIIVFPQGDAHVLSSEPGMQLAPELSLYEKARSTPLPFSTTLEGDGPDTARFVCGFLGCDARPFNPLLTTVPRSLRVHAGAAEDGGWLGQLSRVAIEESRDKRPGGESVLSRLSELMFIEVVRRYLQYLPPQQTGWPGCATATWARRSTACTAGPPMPGRSAAWRRSACRDPSSRNASPTASGRRPCTTWRT